MEPDLVEIFGSYMSWKVTEDTWIINAMGGSQNRYLLEGGTHALLIDTLWGAGNLRSHVEGLTEKPVIVINTHGHLDHSGGNGEWEEVLMLEGAIPDVGTCYRSPFDVSKLPHPDYKKTVVKDGDTIDLGGRVLEIIDITAHSNGSLALLDRKNRQLFVGDELESAQVLMLAGAIPDVETCYRSPFDVSKLPHPDYKKTPVKDGDVIDLGGRVVEIIDITAHSNGSLALLDRKNRQLFVGDELESAQVLMYEVEEARKIEGRPAFILKDRLIRHHANTLKLLALKEHWDTVYPAHNGAPIAVSYVEDYAGLTEHIFAGDAVIEDKLNHKYIEHDNPDHGLCRVRWKSASFFVKKADLMKLWGSNAL